MLKINIYVISIIKLKRNIILIILKYNNYLKI